MHLAYELVNSIYLIITLDEITFVFCDSALTLELQVTLFKRKNRFLSILPFHIQVQIGLIYRFTYVRISVDLFFLYLLITLHMEKYSDTCLNQIKKALNNKVYGKVLIEPYYQYGLKFLLNRS